MAKKTYYEKLKDPRWQKKRLEVLSANEFTCQSCYDSESTLHVHHKEYFKDREPWDYENDQLAVLCESCHESTHEQDIFKYVASFLEYDGPRCRDHIALIIAGYAGLDYEKVLVNSSWEDCAFTKAYYDLGLKVSDMNVNIKAYMKMYEDKNG